MKSNLFKSCFGLMLVLLLVTIRSFGQGENINLQAGNYDKDPYPAYNPDGTVLGTYTIRATKSAHTFTAGQFTINIAFPPGAVYAGNANLPAEFGIQEGADGSSAVVIAITGNWSGTGPAALRTLVIPVRIVGASDDQPTGTVLQWLDPFVTENPAANLTGSPLNIADVNLPVSLVSFLARKEGQTAVLSWSTSEETNSDRFEIERSQNGRSWNKIGSVESAKESKVMMHYAFTDDSPANGENLYRLKMVDRAVGMQDEYFTYSGIRPVKFDRPQDVYIYPNPAIDRVKLNNTIANSTQKIEIVRVDGSIAYQSATVSPEGIDVSKLTAGTYVFKIIHLSGALNTQKLVIQR